MLADNPQLILYVQGHELYAGWLMSVDCEGDVFVCDVEL